MYKMTRSDPYKLFRGRKIKDEVWNKLVESPLTFIPDDQEENILLLNAGTPTGCFLTQGGKELSDTDWRCHFFVAGEQRVLGRGSAYQCAKLYDYALFHFEKYRVRKSCQYNFSRQDAESDINFESGIVGYLTGLEQYLLSKGVLSLPAKREVDKEKQREQRHRRTAAGALEHWIAQIQPHIFDIAEQNDEAVKMLKSIDSRLTAIEAHLRIT